MGGGAVQRIGERRRRRTSLADWMREEASLDILLDDMGGVGHRFQFWGWSWRFGTVAIEDWGCLGTRNG